MNRHRATAVAASSAAVCLLFAGAPSGCGGPSHNASSPAPASKPTWPAPTGSDTPQPQTEIVELPPPQLPNWCTSAEDPLPSGLEMSFGRLTGTVYSACAAPEVPLHYTITLTILAKVRGGYMPVKSQSYSELPGIFPLKSPYTVIMDECWPGVYALRMYVDGVGSDGKKFTAGPTQGGDYKVWEDDC